MAVSWIKSGAAAQQAVKEDTAKKEAKAAERGKLFRFWLKPGEDASITFVDGSLNPDNTLNALMYREHMTQVGGEWTQFVCVSDVEPCPLCEDGDDPSLVAVLTVIDHREYTSKKGVKYKDTQKLFVMKMGTYQQLSKLAAKRGGLAGWRVDVSRTGDKSPNVGDVFDFVGEPPKDLKELEQKYTRTYQKDGKDVTESVFYAAEYEKELPFFPATTLREMGFGNTPLSHGNSAAPAAGDSKASMEENL